MRPSLQLSNLSDASMDAEPEQPGKEVQHVPPSASLRSYRDREIGVLQVDGAETCAALDAYKFAVPGGSAGIFLRHLGHCTGD